MNLGCRYRCAGGFDQGVRRNRNGHHPRRRLRARSDVLPFLRGDARPLPRRRARDVHHRLRTILGAGGADGVAPAITSRISGARGAGRPGGERGSTTTSPCRRGGIRRRRAGIRDVLGDDEMYQFQARRFDLVCGDRHRHSGTSHGCFTKILDAGLTIVPAVNLIRNIGCLGGNSLPPTHPVANLPTSPMAFPLRHPRTVAVDRAYDRQHVRRIVEGFAQTH